MVPPSLSAPRHTPVTTPTKVEAVRSLARVARVLDRASGELGLAHYRVLSALAGGEERASRVAARFGLGRATISVAVEAMCRAGLIERDAVATDQRAFALHLTPYGWDVLERVETEMVRVVDELCSCLSPASSTNDAIAVLAALGEALDTRAERRAPPPGRPRTTRSCSAP